MNYETLLVEVGDDFVATITLNRPESWNAFNTTMATELDLAFRELDADDDVRAIIVRGAGKSFCVGIDLNEFFGKTPTEYHAWVERMEHPLITITHMGTPVIAQVHGVAAANGCGIVAAADMAVAADDARMGLTAINVGLSCLGPVIPVTRIMGRKRSLEMLLFGELFKADDALAMGLVNKVVPPSDLETATRHWASLLAKKSPVAVQLSKKAFYATIDQEYHKAFDYMNEAFSRLCSTEDGQEGVKAFLEKRDPDWKGR